MKTIIAGSRTITNYDLVEKAIQKSNIDITEIVSGTASGVDSLGEQYAKKYNIPIKQFPADWNTYGKRAGYLRNVEMAEYADACIIIWDGSSKGSKMMIDIARQHNLVLFIQKVKGIKYE